MKKSLCTLTACLIFSACVGAFPVYAAGSYFTDVPSTHWAYSFINEMAEGGLIAGYGSGIYGPEDSFNIDQMATIICSAKGAPQKNQNGYWAYGAVEYCINTLKCLPSQGEINAENYAVPCTRELAYYMLMTGLGVGPDSTATANNTLLPSDIPDYASISVAYQQAILKAYKYGLTTGTDDKLTFQPKALLNRAQAATMFVRAGCTEATTVATPVTEGKTVDEIYAVIKATGNWTEDTDEFGRQRLTYNDRYTGAIEVVLTNTMNGKILEVVLREYSLEGLGLIEYSAFKYAGRQVAKGILETAFPTKANDAYMDMKSVLLQETYEYGGVLYPSVLRWYDDHAYICHTDGLSHIMSITIGELNNENAYNFYKSQLRSASTQTYVSYAGGPMMDMEAFELDKW